MVQKYPDGQIKDYDVSPNKLRYLLVWTALSTGLMIYLPVFMILDRSYLIPGDYEFIRDLLIFITSIAVAVGALFAWWRVYLQFKKDKTKSGFSVDKSGLMLTLEIVLEASLTFLLFYFL